MPETANFCLLDIWRYQTFPIGSAKIITSIKRFRMEIPMKNFRVLTHLEGTVVSQKPRMGVQENIATRRYAVPQATTSAPITFVAIINPRVGKIER